MIDKLVLSKGGKMYQSVTQQITLGGGKSPCDPCRFKEEGRRCSLFNRPAGDTLCAYLYQTHKDKYADLFIHFEEIGAVPKDTTIKVGDRVVCVKESCCNGMEVGATGVVTKVREDPQGADYDVLEDDGTCTWDQCVDCMEKI